MFNKQAVDAAAWRSDTWVSDSDNSIVETVETPEVNTTDNESRSEVITRTMKDVEKVKGGLLARLWGILSWSKNSKSDNTAFYADMIQEPQVETIESLEREKIDALDAYNQMSHTVNDLQEKLAIQKNNLGDVNTRIETLESTQAGEEDLIKNPKWLQAIETEITKTTSRARYLQKLLNLETEKNSISSLITKIQGPLSEGEGQLEKSGDALEKIKKQLISLKNVKIANEIISEAKKSNITQERVQSLYDTKLWESEKLGTTIEFVMSYTKLLKNSDDIPSESINKIRELCKQEDVEWEDFTGKALPNKLEGKLREKQQKLESIVFSLKAKKENMENAHKILWQVEHEKMEEKVSAAEEVHRQAKTKAQEMKKGKKWLLSGPQQDLENARDEKEKQVWVLTTEIATLETNYRSASEDLESKKKEFERVVDEKSKAVVTLNSARLDWTKKDDIDAIRKRIDDLRREKATIERDQNRFSDIKMSAKSNLDNANSRLTTLQEDNTLVDNAQWELTRITQEIDKNISDAEEERDTRGKELEDLRWQLSALKADLKSKYGNWILKEEIVLTENKLDKALMLELNKNVWDEVTEVTELAAEILDR